MENKKLSQVKNKLEAADVAAVKSIVEATLQEMHELEIQKNLAQATIKTLKHDLADLKDGRLDRIVERHNISSEALSASVFSIKQLTESKSNSHWYDSFEIVLETPCDGETFTARHTLNNSVFKTHSNGTYKLKDGTVKLF